MLETRELARRPGSMQQLHLTVPAPADLGIEVIGVPEGADVELDLRLESVVEGVLVSGTARAQLRGECARCLDQVDDEIVVDLQELYAYDDEERDVDDEEEFRLEGDLLDLELVLRDAVVLALPQAPLCRPDCPGLCAECGERLADDPGHSHDVYDPRWAALSGLPAGEQTEARTVQDRTVQDNAAARRTSSSGQSKES